MKIRKAFKYRLKPTAEQSEKMSPGQERQNPLFFNNISL
jgi:hypothetical protein